MSSVNLTVEVAFDTDWGVGTGTGLAGDLDSVVATDDLGLPMLPAKTLTGVLRSACEEAAAALGEGDRSWQPVLDHVFGSQPALGTDPTRAPVPAALSVRPALLPASVRDYVRRVATQAGEDSARLLREAASTVRPSTAIDAVKGTVVTGSLRFDQRGRAGQILTAPATIDCDGPDIPADVMTLLACGAALIDRVGGKRRRGAGRCRVRILRDGQPLQPHWDAQPEPDRVHARSGSGAVTTAAAQPALAAATGQSDTVDTGPLTRIATVEVTCLTPVIAGSGQRGNVLESWDFIPGTMLLPIIARAIGPQASRLIATRRLIVTDATPAPRGARLVPVARCWQTPKGSAGTWVHNALDGELPVRTVPIRTGWCPPHAPPRTTAEIERVELVERAHAVIDDVTQRPTEATGGLFVTQAIRAGTVLRGDVWAPAGIQLTLPTQARIGRSKKDDYGHVAITAFTTDPDSQTELAGDPAAGSDTGPGTGLEITAWLTSDALVLDDRLRYSTRISDLVDLVAASLGVTRDTGKHVTGYADARRHHGWTVAAGLPRPALIAVAAGTVVRFTATAAPTPAAVAATEARGIGDRTAEGFGRVLINPPALRPTAAADTAGPDQAQDRTQDRHPTSRRPGPPPPPAGPDHDAATTTLWQTAMTAWLNEAATAAAHAGAPDKLGLTASSLSPSALGALREAVVNATQWQIPLTRRLREAVPAPLRPLLGYAPGEHDPGRSTTDQDGGLWELLQAGAWASTDNDLARRWRIRARRLLLLHCIVVTVRGSQASSRDGNAMSSIQEGEASA